MKKLLALIFIAMLALSFALTVFADKTECEHDFLAMRNLTSHYEECQKCFELRNAGSHTYENGKCTVCGYDEFVPLVEDIKGEGAHEHKLMNGADEDYHFEECQVCFERFEVKDHTFKDGICTFCGHKELVNPFTDVSDKAWYYTDVIRAYADKLINGKTETKFEPDMNITYAEAIKLAACMHQKYTTGEVTLTVGNPWYAPYLEYCIENGILREEHGYDLNAPATRQGYMRIFAYSLPADALEVINYVAENAIPDVKNDPAIYKLYRAGIVGGVDAARNCNPDANIKRSEVAAVLTRMMNPAARVEFTLGEAPKEEIPTEVFEKLTVTKQPEYVANADDGMLIHYSVTVEGGKAPYTYEWFYYVGVKNQTATIENGEFAHVDGNTLGLGFYLGSPYLSKRFACRITDANGESVVTNILKMPEAPFTMDIEDVISNSLGTIVVGRVKTGKIVPGEYITFTFDDKSAYGAGKVEAIEMFNKQLGEATVNDRVGLLIKECETFMSRDAALERDKQGLIGDTKNIAVKEAFSVRVGDTPSGKIGDWTKMSVYAVGGTAPYTYVWQALKDGKTAYNLTSIAKSEEWANGFDKDTLNILITEQQYAFGMSFRCMITDAAGNIAYSDAYIPTPHDLVIAKHPESVYANYGDEVQFKVKALGESGSALTYQWRYIYDGAKSFKDVLPSDTWASGCNTDTLTIQVEKTELTDHIYYHCVVTDAEGNEAITAAATIFPEKPFISKQPGEVAAKPDTYIKFGVLAEGRYAPLSYQWYYYIDGLEGFLPVSKDHEWAEGENTNTLTVGVDRQKFNSSFKCYCVVTDANGNTVKSAEGTVLLSDDAGVNLETGHAPKDYPIVLIW